MKKIKFPYYSGNIKLTNVLGYVDIDTFIFVHKNPKPATLNVLEEIKKAGELGDKQLKRKLKHKLFAFTPSVYIGKGYARKYDNVLSWTGLMQLDFDGIPDVNTAIDIKHYVFEKPEIVCTYISPSGTGVKALMKIKIPEDKAHYKALHKGMVSEFEETGYLDLATNNAMLPLFVSADKDILFRNYDNCPEFSKEDWNKPEYIRLNNEKPNNFNSNDGENKTLRILADKINNININGHPQVRSAALILGSRVGAGYLDVITAQNEITNLIKSNSYLSKGYSGYLSTALWGISEGYKNPKYYD
jgi:hypothetical protein